MRRYIFNKRLTYINRIFNIRVTCNLYIEYFIYESEFPAIKTRQLRVGESSDTAG